MSVFNTSLTSITHLNKKNRNEGKVVPKNEGTRYTTGRYKMKVQGALMVVFKNGRDGNV